MGLVRDLQLVQDATAIPALREVVREALIRAMFVRDERALPKDVVRVLTRKADVTVRVKDEIEVREAVRVANGETSTVDLGRPADEFHYYRRQLGMGKDQSWGVCTRPSLVQTYEWIVPPQGGILVDTSALADVEVDGISYVAKAGAGARWKDLYDRAVAAGMLPSVFPAVPLDFAVGDALVGDAKFRSYRSSFSSAVYDVRGLAARTSRPGTI
ncbi:MAG: FAD-binding oxidoreductase [Methanobacteriota archaeon]|nr:MAG: FAD-binding oxidoreductase [Euryarchaeota archaeon]